MLGNFFVFFCLLIFSKLLISKSSFRNILSVSNSLDPNCLEKLSANKTSRHSINIDFNYFSVTLQKLDFKFDLGLQITVCIGKLFSLFLIQTYVVGTQKNHLNETVLLSTQNIC